MRDLIEKYANEYKFSDIHIKEGTPISLRIHGDMTRPNKDIITKQMLRDFADNVLTDDQKNT